MGGRFRKRPLFTLVDTSKHLLFSVRSRGGVGHKIQSSTTPQFRKYSKKRCPLLARVSVLVLGGAVQQVRWWSALPSSGSPRHGQHVLPATGFGLVWFGAGQPSPDWQRCQHQAGASPARAVLDWGYKWHQWICLFKALLTVLNTGLVD